MSVAILAQESYSTFNMGKMDAQNFSFKVDGKRGTQNWIAKRYANEHRKGPMTHGDIAGWPMTMWKRMDTELQSEKNSLRKHARIGRLLRNSANGYAVHSKYSGCGSSEACLRIGLKTLHVRGLIPYHESILKCHIQCDNAPRARKLAMRQKFKPDHFQLDVIDVLGAKLKKKLISLRASKWASKHVKKVAI